MDNGHCSKAMICDGLKYEETGPLMLIGLGFVIMLVCYFLTSLDAQVLWDFTK